MIPRIDITRGTETYPLWVTQDTDSDITNDISVTKIPYQPPEDNVRFPKGQQEQGSVAGIVTPDLFNGNDFGYSDGVEGMAEWVQDVFAITGAQGQPYTITDRLRDETYQGYIDWFNISLSYPRDSRVNWDLQLIVGDGILPRSDVSRRTANPSDTASIGGVTIENPVSLQITKNVETDTTVVPDPTADGGPEDNFVEESGVGRQFSLGTKDLSDTLLSSLRDMRELGETYTFETSFPGASYDISIEEISVNRDTETPVEYDIEMIQ